jgi:hypothetical protein
MRRPRGPGGRFLTADEIAVQKTSNCDLPGPSATIDQENDDDMDDTELERDELLPDNITVQPNLHAHHRDGFAPVRNPDPVNLINADFRQISHSPLVPSHADRSFPSDSSRDQSAVHISSPNIKSLPPNPPSPSRNLFAHAPAHRSKGTTNTAPVMLCSPYPSMQMHHVAHHAPHHESQAKFAHEPSASGVVRADNDSSQVNMQRRTEEMIRRTRVSGP